MAFWDGVAEISLGRGWYFLVWGWGNSGVGEFGGGGEVGRGGFGGTGGLKRFVLDPFSTTITKSVNLPA